MIAAAAMLTCMIPSAQASDHDAVISVRSFPKVSSARKNLLAESTSATVGHDADWGGIETLNVPQTQSQAEKDKASAHKESDSAAKAESQAASRNQSRADLTVSGAVQAQSAAADAATGSAVSAGAAASVDRAYSLIGGHMDCTRLVTLALAARGINFSGWPEDYAHVPGGYLVTDGTMQPGDILIYANTGGWNGGAHYDHVALYVGGGMAVHGGWNGSSVALASATSNPVTLIVRIP